MGQISQCRRTPGRTRRALGLIAVSTQGLPSRIPPNLRAIATWSELDADDDWRAHRCYYPPEIPDDYASECTPAKRPGVQRVLLWGDSHAAHLYPGLLGGAWELYLERGESEAEILRSVDETVRRLRANGNGEIVIFGPGPTWKASLANDLFRFMATRRLNEIPERYGHPLEAVWQLDAAMAALAQELGVRYVSVLNYFCNKSGCRTLGDRSIPKPDLLYRDRDHLTATGSKDLIAHSGLPWF